MKFSYSIFKKKITFIFQIKQLHNSDPSMIGCLWVECSMNGWRPITRMCSFSQKVIPRIPQLAAKSCKCTQRKKSYDPPPLPLNSRGSRASQQRNCGLSELSFSAICLLFSWCLVQTSLTWQGVITYSPTCTSWYKCVTHMINTWESSLLFSSFSSSISKYISDLVMDMVPLMAAPGAISLQVVDRATGPAKSQRQSGLLFALYSCHFTDITYIQTSLLFVT